MNRILMTALVVLFAWSVKSEAQTNTLSSRLAAEPLEQLVSDVTKFGNPERGAVAFYLPTMNCAKCHESTDQQLRLGPNLTEKREVQIAHLIESILKPSAQIKQGFETAQVLIDDGTLVTGVFVEENQNGIVLKQIERPDELLQIEADTIDDWRKIKTSTMPEGLANQLSDRQQFLDLVSYLADISRGGAVRAAELKPANLTVLAPLPEYESRVDHAGLIRSLNQESYDRGEELFRLRCASCHGSLEEEGSMPTSLRFATGKFKNGNDPHQMYTTLTHGYGMMNPQRWMVPQQKYDVIHYIRNHFLKSENPGQYFDISETYLASLPKGNTRGPKPVVSRPWTMMDYGPSLMNTVEVSQDGSNIAQKGIMVRLDDGPGGVESGKYWMMYDHDTMRVAGAWSGGFIDYEGIHFNGTHGRHPKVVGNIHFQNPTGPGWGQPRDGSFEDTRLVGRDDKRYGPLDRDWAQYKGMYRFGKRSILNYTVGATNILESPSLKFIDNTPVFMRDLQLEAREQELVVQVARYALDDHTIEVKGDTVMVLPQSVETGQETISTGALEFDGSTFAEIQNKGQFDLASKDFTITARIRTQSDGTIFSETKQQDQWVPQGKTFFIRGGRLTFDIGWVGAVQSKRKVNDGRWHNVAMTWRQSDGRVQFFVDGRPSGVDHIKPESALENSVVRLGFTNDNFPSTSFFEGSIADVRFYQRLLSQAEVGKPAKAKKDRLVGQWARQIGTVIPEATGNKELAATVSGSLRRIEEKSGLLLHCGLKGAAWEVEEDNLRLRVPAGDACTMTISQVPVSSVAKAKLVQLELQSDNRSVDLSRWIRGGSPNWPEVLTTEVMRGDDSGPFAVDVFRRPTKNPWNAQLRLTGVDFLPDGNTMVVASWDGGVWRVSGFGSGNELTWKRIAAGLFQPLGIKWLDGKIYVTCRDQLVRLHDLNDDGEMDYYECFNNDHQVTEHFHEFAMGLQVDDRGNFYYAKSARHAKTAVVPHHGTLLKVSADGKRTEILANGFRAANGVCINPDGSFVVTDQEGHWNPKNRINWVRPGGFYGNMFGYHDVEDDSDEAMDQPLCWITNAFDRSPSELLWVESEKWGPLNGSLLNFSYGYGKVYVVPHEEVDGQMQGGMCEFPLPQFPTGVMRGRFHPGDGQLYCCGMFAWGGAQHQPGGLYRIRYTGNPVHLPIGLKASPEKIRIKLSGKIDPQAGNDPENYSINTWDLKRTRNYGSKHYNEKRLKVVDARILEDGQTVELLVPQLKPTWGMEINYSLLTQEGAKLQGKIHNSIYKLQD